MTLGLLAAGTSVVSAAPAAPDPDPAPSLTAEADAPAPATSSATSAKEAARKAMAEVDSETGLWVVQLEKPSVAVRFGASAAASSESVRYADQLATGHADLGAEISSTLGRPLEATFTYENVLNAIAVEADADEASQLCNLDGVVAVHPDTVREMETDVSHEVIQSAAAWDGANAPGIGTRGEGLIAAMIDSGVNPEHPSFAATDGEGYTHTNPRGAGNYLGACATEAGLECNDKLIGAYTFNGLTARDTDGHGSHTGSTMAGNAHTAEFTLGTADFERWVSGVAPRANVISYASAGNDGPGTVAKTGPWNLSVAASTHNRVFGNPVSVTNEGAPEGARRHAGLPR